MTTADLWPASPAESYIGLGQIPPCPRPFRRTAQLTMAIAFTDVKLLPTRPVKRSFQKCCGQAGISLLPMWLNRVENHLQSGQHENASLFPVPELRDE